MWSCSLRFHHPTTESPPVETFMCLFEAQSSVCGPHIIKQPLEDTVRHHKGACVYFSSQVILHCFDLNASCRKDNLHGCTNIWIHPKATSVICTICQPPSHLHTHQVCGELLSPSPPIRKEQSSRNGMALPFTLQQHQKLLYFYCITGWSSSILFCTSSFTTTSATHIKLWVPFWTLNYKPSTQPHALKPPLLPVTECSLLLKFLTFIETVTTDCYKGIICIPNLYTGPFEHVRQQWPLTQMHCASRQSKWMTHLRMAYHCVFTHLVEEVEHNMHHNKKKIYEQTHQLLQQEFFSLSYCKTALTKHSNLNLKFKFK